MAGGILRFTARVDVDPQKLLTMPDAMIEAITKKVAKDMLAALRAQKNDPLTKRAP